MKIGKGEGGEKREKKNGLGRKGKGLSQGNMIRIGEEGKKRKTMTMRI